MRGAIFSTILCSLLALSACGGDDSGPTGDAPDADAGVPVGQLDSGGTPDAGRRDFGVTDRPDTGEADVGLEDAGLADQGVDAGVELDAGPSDADSADSGPVDSGPVDTGIVDDGPAVLNPNWIGGPCQGAADCSFTDGVCNTQAQGYPLGMCTQPCTQFCPDQAGTLNSLTFCIDDDGQDGTGMCASRCDFTLSPTGCRNGYVCQPEKRMNQPSVVRYACVPRSGLPNRPTPANDVGAACLSASDCNYASCIDGLPGGYCTKEACQITGCPSGTRCWQLGGTEEFFACLDDCTQSGECRQGEGYACDSQQTCWYAPPPRPACNLNGVADCSPYAAQVSQDFVVVTKSQRRLTLCNGATPVESYCIGLGWSPTLDKEREGDGRTPEGIFYIPRLIPASQYYKAFLLSYPDNADAARGLAAGIITQAEHDAIVAAQNGGTEPPQYTGLGGLIEIHGMGSSSDWTWGCIALDNPAVDVLWQTLGVGDNIVVLH